MSDSTVDKDPDLVERFAEPLMETPNLSTEGSPDGASTEAGVDPVEQISKAFMKISMRASSADPAKWQPVAGDVHATGAETSATTSPDPDTTNSAPDSQGEDDRARLEREVIGVLDTDYFQRTQYGTLRADPSRRNRRIHRYRLKRRLAARLRVDSPGGTGTGGLAQ
ncbi:hypothetical protein AYO21_10985 [Fonsecaea monophora]|uniref:Uncharacterized protein n=1 Tax=Fonsecaea monophora TaxID=254056 RepID=A0A177ES49_9EURO|nr:hypothetical protein AYO21_10985 [Fonsecaea monophora]KAH0837599.1 hypothetical protein FOPE_05228 [Fonsecaea pedrosoi]OAG34823.1 hypothetical protein AYO21_10985 [Fonsecaea monophora]